MGELLAHLFLRQDDATVIIHLSGRHFALVKTSCTQILSLTDTLYNAYLESDSVRASASNTPCPIPSPNFVMSHVHVRRASPDRVAEG